MSECLNIDLETFSEIPIKNGVHAYAEHAEIMLFAWAINNEPVQVWDLTVSEDMPVRLHDALKNDDITVWAHNSHFDRTILRHCMPDMCPVLTRWRDTMVQALAHSLPGSLGQLCDVLGVPSDKAKDKEGKTLINLFCKPRPKSSKLRRATRETHPEEWQRFVSYAGNDIEAMREVRKRIPSWNYRGNELELWKLDQRINDRGFCVDMALVNGAISAVDDAQTRLAEQTIDATNGEVKAATQRDALLTHIERTYGMKLDDLTKSTVSTLLSDTDLPKELRELLAIRLQASATSTSKYKALLKSVSRDARLRGTLQFCGASRTGRWAGRLFQPQNISRGSVSGEKLELGIESIKTGCADLLFDNVTELASSALRGCIVAPDDKRLVVSDLSNIEGRMLAWLAGEEWKLQAFRDNDAGKGQDLYKLAYARAFNINPDNVDKYQRQIGKVMELGLGYGGGVPAFVTFALVYGLDLEELADAALPNIPNTIKCEAKNWYDESVKRKSTYGLSERAFIACDSLKRLWRNAHPATTKLWKDMGDTVIKALNRKDVTLNVLAMKIRYSGSWLRIQLPSGRALCYPLPKMEDGNITYMGMNSYTRKWERLKTYGGKLVENLCQAAARDVLAENMQHIENAGYKIVLTVHDEVICEAPDTAEYSVDGLSKLLALNSPWSEGLPLNAAGFEAYRYRKD